MICKYIKTMLFVSIFTIVTMLNARDNNSITLTLPLYSHPSDTQEGIGTIWDAVADAGSLVPIIVIVSAVSDHDEAVGRPSENYFAGLERLRQGNITILAYITTDKGQRDIDLVKSNIYDYATYFDIDGIFLDEGVAFDEFDNGEALFTYYEDITDYANSFVRIKKVMLNASYIIKEDIERSIIDDFIVFENHILDWDTFSPSQYIGIDYNRLHIIVHGDFDSSRMQSLIQESVENKITNVYFTDREFSYLPSFWHDEVAAIKAYNDTLKSSFIPIVHYLLF